MVMFLASGVLYLIFFSWGWGLISFGLAVSYKLRFEPPQGLIDKFWGETKYPSRLWFMSVTSGLESGSKPSDMIAAATTKWHSLIFLIFGVLLLILPIGFCLYFFLTSMADINNMARTLITCLILLFVSIWIIVNDLRNLTILRNKPSM